MGAGGEGGGRPGNDDYVIIGAGPVGLLAALGLIQEQGARKVTIYEARDGLTARLQESYPIGLNPRGVKALDRANPDLALAIRQRGAMVDAWRIYAGRWKVAEVRSGLVIGTTRSNIAQTLYDELRRHHAGKVTVHWGHRLEGIDTLHRRLHFTRRRRQRGASAAKKGGSGSEEEVVAAADGGGGGVEEEEEIVVDASGARVLACDGAWSRVRASAEATVAGFKSQVAPWHVEFRLLFSKPGARAAGLDPRYHYIINGVYVSVIEGDVWVLALGVKDDAPPGVRALLSSREATPANVAALRAYVTQMAPQAAPFLTEEDMVQFFGRRSFRGAVVKVNQLHLGEWLVFLGDAAHSVIPPTGEGFNSGAEDVGVLMDAMHDRPEAPFAEYDRVRLPDLHALHLLATDANTQLGPLGPEKTAGLLCKMIIGVFKALGAVTHTCEDLTFGVDSCPPRSYEEIVSMWKWQRFFPLLVARLVAYPLFLLYWVVALPFGLLRRLLWGGGDRQQMQQQQQQQQRGQGKK